jgi:tRNA (adenine37-N6)-methyltransferase
MKSQQPREGPQVTFAMRRVGVVTNARTDPSDSDFWGNVISTITLEPVFGPETTRGLAGFSHVEILFVFDRAVERASYQARPPRGRCDLPPVGVFADRGPRRPNRLGATICRLDSVDSSCIRVSGLDAIDGTPVLDIKPVMAHFLPAEMHQPEWTDKLMIDYFRDRP